MHEYYKIIIPSDSVDISIKQDKFISAVRILHSCIVTEFIPGKSSETWESICFPG